MCGLPHQWHPPSVIQNRGVRSSVRSSVRPSDRPTIMFVPLVFPGPLSRSFLSACHSLLALRCVRLGFVHSFIYRKRKRKERHLFPFKYSDTLTHTHTHTHTHIHTVSCVSLYCISVRNEGRFLFLFFLFWTTPREIDGADLVADRPAPVLRPVHRSSDPVISSVFSFHFFLLRLLLLLFLVVFASPEYDPSSSAYTQFAHGQMKWPGGTRLTSWCQVSDHFQSIKERKNEKKIDRLGTRLRRKVVVPFVLLFQFFFFYLPHFILFFFISFFPNSSVRSHPLLGCCCRLR